VSSDFSFGDVEINQSGSHAIGQQFNTGTAPGDALDNLPDDDLARFVRAVADAVEALRLAPQPQQQLLTALAGIRTEAGRPDPDQALLRRFAGSMYRVVEGAASRALSSVLLGLWHP
jgi:hypothetical protein